MFKKEYTTLIDKRLQDKIISKNRDLAQQLEQAQLESDYEQIMERYQLRKDQDSQAAQNQKAMAALLAQAGDFSLYGALYGLTPEQIRRLEAHYAAQQES